MNITIMKDRPDLCQATPEDVPFFLAFYDHDHEGCSWACIAAFNGKESNERTI